MGKVSSGKEGTLNIGREIAKFSREIGQVSREKLGNLRIPREKPRFHVER